MWVVLRTHQVLCLKCQDEWMGCASELLEKRGFVWSRKIWVAAFNEFLQTKPKELDVVEHNRSIQSGDRVIRAMFPQYYEEKPSV